MKVAIITEGLQGTGYGHLTRCLSVYQAFEEKNIIPCYIADCDDNGKKYIPNVNLIQLDWLSNPEKLYELIKDYDIAIIDSYLAPIEIYEKIQKLVATPVYIDDYIRLDYLPGIIINGTIGAENLPYKKDDRHKYLLGLEYIPLRKEFWDVDIKKKNKKEIKDVLITFGGQDFRGLTFPILDLLLENYPQFNYHIIKGISNNEVKYPTSIYFYTSLNAREILNLMLECDLAISSAGQTSYELNRMGLPSLLIGVIENQKYNLAGWKEVGYILNKIWYDDKNIIEKIISEFDIYVEIFKKNRIYQNEVYVDGQGARRIVYKLINKQ